MALYALEMNNEMIRKFVLDRLMLDLVTHSGQSQRYPKEELNHLGISLCFSFPTVALFEIAGNHQNTAWRDKNKDIRNFLECKICKKNQLVFSDDSYRIGVLMSWDDRNCVEWMKSIIAHEFSCEVRAGIGMPCSQLNEIHKSFEQASAALEGSFYKEQGGTVWYNELQPGQMEYDYPSEAENDLFRSLCNGGTKKELESFIEKFYNELLKKGPLVKEMLFEATIRLMVGLEKRVTTESGKSQMYANHGVMSVMRMESFADLKTYLFDFLYDLKEWSASAGKEIHNSVIKKMIQYMEENCQSVTLNTVAEKVYMTPTYLSLLFKMNTGRTFIEQLTDIRIQKAKNLLRHTSLKNYEVAERVGYQDPRYFSQIFKKKVGLSPSEFRESVQV